MSINFQCENCGRTLKVAEANAGKKAKCPQCEAVNLIPMLSQPAAATAGGNPFAEPAESSAMSRLAPGSRPAATPPANPSATELDAAYSSPSSNLGQNFANANNQLGGIFAPLADKVFYMRIAAWGLIIMGALYCITIIYAIIGWLPLWMGILLRNATIAIEDGQKSGNAQDFHKATKNLGTFFTILGVVTMIYMVLIAAALLFLVIFLIVGLANA